MFQIVVKKEACGREFELYHWHFLHSKCKQDMVSILALANLKVCSYIDSPSESELLTTYGARSQSDLEEALAVVEATDSCVFEAINHYRHKYTRVSVSVNEEEYFVELLITKDLTA